MRKFASIDFSVCNPKIHDCENGLCAAAYACGHRLLEQEEPFESPILLSATMCVGCGECVSACPLHAITVSRGM